MSACSTTRFEGRRHRTASKDTSCGYWCSRWFKRTKSCRPSRGRPLLCLSLSLFLKELSRVAKDQHGRTARRRRAPSASTTAKIHSLALSLSRSLALSRSRSLALSLSRTERSARSVTRSSRARARPTSPSRRSSSPSRSTRAPRSTGSASSTATSRSGVPLSVGRAPLTLTPKPPPPPPPTVRSAAFLVSRRRAVTTEWERSFAFGAASPQPPPHTGPQQPPAARRGSFLSERHGLRGSSLALEGLRESASTPLFAVVTLSSRSAARSLASATLACACVCAQPSNILVDPLRARLVLIDLGSALDVATRLGYDAKVIFLHYITSHYIVLHHITLHYTSTEHRAPSTEQRAASSEQRTRRH